MQKPELYIHEKQTPHRVYRACDKCGEHMHGIMRVSDLGKSRAPRSICYDCEQGKK